MFCAVLHRSVVGVFSKPNSMSNPYRSCKVKSIQRFPTLAVTYPDGDTSMRDAS
jgi:hypothetical protein